MNKTLSFSHHIPTVEKAKVKNTITLGYKTKQEVSSIIQKPSYLRIL
jgi:hypothetical protein